MLAPCANNPCQNGGTCFGNEDGFSCYCLPNYNGTFCETWIFGKINFHKPHVIYSDNSQFLLSVERIIHIYILVL